MTVSRKKAGTLLLTLSIMSFFAAFLFFAFNFSFVKSFMFKIFELYKGQPLNMQNVGEKLDSFIKMNFIIFFFIGTGLLLAKKVSFTASKTQDFSLKFSSDNRFYKVSILIVFICLTALRIYWAAQKSSYHVDECYGIGIASQSEHAFWVGSDFDVNRPYTGRQINEEVFFNDASLKDFFKDMAHLWIYNKDSAYTSLYLMLFRLSFIFTKTCDFGAIVLRGITLNLVFFAFAFYFMLLMLEKLTDNRITIPLVLFAAFSTPASVGLTVFLRSYALQEALIILFSYFFVFYYKKILSGGGEFRSVKNFISGTLLIGIVLSSDYFILFYAALLGAAVIIACLRRKQSENALFFISMALCSLIVAKLLYLSWGSTVLSGR